MKALTTTAVVLTLFAALALSLSCSDDDKGTNTDPVVISLVVSDTMDAGSWTVCWDQTNSSGAQVAAGTYRAEIAVGDFRKSEQFVISTEVQTGQIVMCDTVFENPTGGHQLPSEFAMVVGQDEYAVGAIVDIEVGIAERRFATIRIMKP